MSTQTPESRRTNTPAATCYFHYFHPARVHTEILSSESNTTHRDERDNRTYSPISTMYTGFWLLPHSDDPSLRKRPQASHGKQDDKTKGWAMSPNKQDAGVYSGAEVIGTEGGAKRIYRVGLSSCSIVVERYHICTCRRSQSNEPFARMRPP